MSSSRLPCLERIVCFVWPLADPGGNRWSDRQVSSTARSRRRRRAGSAKMSMATIFPSVIVKPKAARGVPPGAQRPPQSRPRVRVVRRGHALRMPSLLPPRHAPPAPASVRPCPATLCPPPPPLRRRGAPHRGRVPPAARQSRRRAKRRGMPPRSRADGRGWRREPQSSPAPGAGRGWRVAVSPPGSARRWSRSPRRGRRTGRAARRRAARQGPAYRALRAARGRPRRPGALPVRDRPRPRRSRPARTPVCPATPRAATCASAADRGRRGRPPWSASHPGSPHRSCRCG